MGDVILKKVKSVMPHFNYVHCGVDILSMSKRIMNKVFSCCGDCSIKVHYQDTYSTHMNYGVVDKVVELYKQTYNQELVGDGLGNFHVDFSMDGEFTGTYGIESLLNKRTYMNILEPTGKDGNTIHSEHIRCRGIPTSWIKYKQTKIK